MGNITLRKFIPKMFDMQKFVIYKQRKNDDHMKNKIYNVCEKVLLYMKKHADKLSVCLKKPVQKCYL